MEPTTLLPILVSAVLAVIGAVVVWVVRTLYQTSVNLRGLQTEIKDQGARILKLELTHAKMSQVEKDVAVLTERSSHQVDSLNRIESKQAEISGTLSRTARNSRASSQ